MKREFFDGLNLDKDVIDSIMAEHGKDIERYKSRISEQEGQIKSLSENLSGTQTRIAEFESADIDGLKKSADEFKQKWEQAEENAKRDINSLKLDFSVREALAKANAKNTAAVYPLLNMNEISFEDGKLSGLDEQISRIKESDSYLFETQRPEFEISSQASGTEIPAPDAVKTAMGLNNF